MTTSLRADFRYEFEAELDLLSRKRFYIWVIAGIVFWLLVLLITILRLLIGKYFQVSVQSVVNPGTGGDFELDSILVCIKILVNCAIMVLGMIYAKRRILGHEHVLRITLWMLVAIGVNVSLINGVRLSTGSINVGDFYLIMVALPLVADHFFACAILPWTQKHAVLPGFALWLIWLVGIVLIPGPDGGMITIFVTAVIVMIMFLPGIIVCALRTTVLGQNFEKRMLEQSYIAYSRELFDARKIHEALFPEPALDGNIRYVYHDRPRTGIGGDLLHAHFDAQEINDSNLSIENNHGNNKNHKPENIHKTLNLVIVDVGGDGIAAALTVNRLHGEIERLYAEQPEIAPDKMITLLNRYAFLTLAPIGIYAVAMCVRIGADGKVQWSGAGHVPALIKQGDNSIMQLESTTWPLGTANKSSPEHCMHTTQISKGDTLVLYTDGACEYKSMNGERLGYSGVRDIIRDLKTNQIAGLPVLFFENIDQHQVNDSDNENTEIVQEDVLFVAAEITW